MSKSRKKRRLNPLLIYGAIFLVFIVWMVYFDDHSILIHRELNSEVSRLQKEKKLLDSQIADVQQQIEVLRNPDSIQKYAREEYFYKAEGEVIYIIDSATIETVKNQ